MKKELSPKEREVVLSLLVDMKFACNYFMLEKYSDQLMKYLGEHITEDFVWWMSRENEVFHKRCDEIAILEKERKSQAKNRQVSIYPPQSSTLFDLLFR